MAMTLARVHNMYNCIELEFTETHKFAVNDSILSASSFYIHIYVFTNFLFGGFFLKIPKDIIQGGFFTGPPLKS